MKQNRYFAFLYLERDYARFASVCTQYNLEILISVRNDGRIEENGPREKIFDSLMNKPIEKRWDTCLKVADALLLGYYENIASQKEDEAIALFRKGYLHGYGASINNSKFSVLPFSPDNGEYPLYCIGAPGITNVITFVRLPE